MPNEITIAADTPFRRVAKSGKVTVRGSLGAVMSGNTSERATLSRVIAQKLIAGNTYDPVMFEIKRVFGPSTLTKFGVGKVADDFFMIAEDKTISYIGDTWNRDTALQYCRMVQAKVAAGEAKDKFVKGEKSLAAEFADDMVRHIEAKLAAIAAEKVLANA